MHLLCTETETRKIYRESKIIHHGFYHHEGFIIHILSELGTSHHMRGSRFFSYGGGVVRGVIVFPGVGVFSFFLDKRLHQQL